MVFLAGAAASRDAARPLRLSQAFTLRGLQSRIFHRGGGLSPAAPSVSLWRFICLAAKWGVGATGSQLFGCGEHFFPVDRGGRDRLLASTSEEFFVCSPIPFVGRLTKSRALAIILPAFSWSFLHSAYPQEPGYAGIEVGIIGIVAGIVMLHWGIGHAYLALHGGCFAGGLAAGALQQHVFQNFGRDRGPPQHWRR
jgi:hypothetical protein